MFHFFLVTIFPHYSILIIAVTKNSANYIFNIEPRSPERLAQVQILLSILQI